MSQQNTSFNVRVYGILIHNNEILLSHETYMDKAFTKLVGGGLEFGEGTIDALKREFLEELNLPVAIDKHFYTTDFFQPSFVNTTHQIIAIYYKVTALVPDVKQYLSAYKHCFWKDIKQLSINDVDLPIDKIVVEKILDLFEN